MQYLKQYLEHARVLKLLKTVAVLLPATKFCTLTVDAMDPDATLATLAH